MAGSGTAAALALVLAAAAFAWPDCGHAKTQQEAIREIAADLHGVEVLDGERVVIRVNDQGQAREAARGPIPKEAAIVAPWNDNKVETVVKVTASASTAAPDEIVAMFQVFGPRGAVLRVENGFDHPLIYDASVIVREGQNRVIRRTTICPIAAGKVGFESWPAGTEGVIIYNPRPPPDGDMRCTGETGLSTDFADRPNVCIGAPKGSPIQVTLFVDPRSGTRLSADAEWRLGDPARGPTLGVEFPMQQATVASYPISVVVLAVVATDPPPSSKTASIVLAADGVEVERKPWRMFNQNRSAPPPPGAKAVAFVGAVPFPARAQDGSVDPALQSLFMAIGRGQVKTLEVTIQGDDGAVLGHAAFALASADIRNQALVDAALREAERKAAEPSHCAARR